MHIYRTIVPSREATIPLIILRVGGEVRTNGLTLVLGCLPPQMKAEHSAVWVHASIG